MVLNRPEYATAANFYARFQVADSPRGFARLLADTYGLDDSDRTPKRRNAPAQWGDGRALYRHPSLGNDEWYVEEVRPPDGQPKYAVYYAPYNKRKKLDERHPLHPAGQGTLPVLADQQGRTRRYRRQGRGSSDQHGYLIVDLNKIDAATDRHEAAVEHLEARLRERSVEPEEEWSGPPCDLAWRATTGVWFIAEVKSLDGANETQQLRLGLGQVLEYRQRFLEHGERNVRAVLFTEHRPTEFQVWRRVCATVAVDLLWKDCDATQFDRLAFGQSR